MSITAKSTNKTLANWIQYHLYKKGVCQDQDRLILEMQSWLKNIKIYELTAPYLSNKDRQLVVTINAEKGIWHDLITIYDKISQQLWVEGNFLNLKKHLSNMINVAFNHEWLNASL